MVTFVTARWGDAYSEDYTDALRAQVPGIVVLGEDRPLLSPGEYQGWWCKLEVFRPENADLRPALFIDLDTFILERPDELLALAPDLLWLIDDFNHKSQGNSGLFLAPDSPLSDQIWQASRREDTVTHGRGKGDGGFLRNFPHKRINSVVKLHSYKIHQLYDGPKDAKVVCFHGKPKPHETTGWAKDYWTTQICRSRSSAPSSATCPEKQHS